MMQIVANGKPRDVPDGSTILTLLDGFGWRPEWVVVEHNGEPLERGRYAQIVLRNGDRVEVVRAVAGGAMNARERLEQARLYLVCDARRPDLDAFLDAVLAAGVDVLQLRDKEWEAAPLLRAAGLFRAACERHGALFIVNDRPDLAAAAGADGVHLGQDDLPPEAARALLGSDAIIGRSTHDEAQLHRANTEPVDYVCAGPVHETPTKPGRPGTGLGLIEVAARECAKPWFAIGGIDAGSVAAVAAEGARRIVVVRAVTQASDPIAAVLGLREALDSTAPAPVPIRSAIRTTEGSPR